MNESVVLLVGDFGATDMRLALVATGPGGPRTFREASSFWTGSGRRDGSHPCSRGFRCTS